MKKIRKFFLKKEEIHGIDAGRLDLCSGHVQTEEPTFITMQRELKEELGIETTVSGLKNLGTVVVDYTKLQDETNRKNLKCFIDLYGIKIQDPSQIQIDGEEVVQHGWLTTKDAIGFIKNSMTRIPYEERLEPQYNLIFNKLENFIQDKNLNDIIK